MRKYHHKYKRLRLGFVGLGKYGYGVMKAILKSGHHNIDNIYFEKMNDKILKDLATVKQNEIKNNYANLRNLLVRFKDSENITAFLKSHSLSIKDLIEEISKDENNKGILIISLDQHRWEKVRQEMACIVDKKVLENVWLLSSISHLEIEKIKEAIDKNVRIIRYIPNLATMVGNGIISAYIEPEHREEGEVTLKRVFQGLGKIIFVNNEESIDSARIITGSTIGLSTYFAKILSDSIGKLGIEDLGKSQEDAIEIVYYSIYGMLALFKQKEIESWDKLLENLQVSPGKAGESGTIKFITDYLDGKEVPQIIKESIRECHKKYLINNHMFEI